MTDDLTLDPGLGNVLFDVWLLSRVTTARLDGALSGSELDAEEFAIYSILLSNDSGTTPSTLARWTSAPPTTVSSYVKRFERRGHVRRVADPADGRSYRLVLTAEGRQTHADAAEGFLPILAEVTDQLDDAAATHHHLLALRDAIDPETPSGSQQK